METSEQKYEYENPLAEREAVSIVKEDALRKIQPFLLDPKREYPEPFYMLEFNGVPFSTIGGIQAMSGQKKNGKSFVFTMLAAAILKGDPERSRVPSYLPGLVVPQRTIEYLGHEPRVLYVDTEMEMLNSAKVLRRVHWLCGWDMKVPNDRFNVLWVKKVPNDDNVPPYKKRFEIIKSAIDALEPDIVFIDGLRDLLLSINDEETATSILDYLSNTAEERRMCIWNALHQNPKSNSDGEDTKMRGWTGTELGNKVSDTLVSVKNKNTIGVTFTVKQVDARGKDMEDWKFKITDDAGNLGIPRIISNPIDIADEPDTEFEMSEENIKQAVLAAVGSKTLKEFTIREKLKQRNHIGNAKALECITKAVKMGVLQKDGDRYMATAPMFNDDENVAEEDPF